MSKGLSGAVTRREGHLHVEAVPVARIAEAVDTPVFIYSASELVARYDALDRAFAAVPHTICYSIKTNMNLAVVRTLVARGSAFSDIKAVVYPALRHRLILNFEGEAEGLTTNNVIETTLAEVNPNE